MPVNVGGYEITKEMENTFSQIIKSGLVLHLDAGISDSYPGSGTTWFDLSGSGNNSTLVNGVGYNQSSLSFDGSNDQVQIPYSSTFINSNDKTVESWVNTGSIGSSFVIIVTNRGTSGGDNDVTFTLGIDNRQVVRTWNPSGTDSMVLFYGTSNGSASFWAYSKEKLGITNGDNQWHQIVGVTDTSANLIHLYYDGNHVNSAAISGTVRINTQTVRIGSGYSPANTNYPFTGNISNFKVYDKVLSATEITQNFNAVKTRFGL